MRRYNFPALGVFQQTVATTVQHIVITDAGFNQSTVYDGIASSQNIGFKGIANHQNFILRHIRFLQGKIFEDLG